MTRTDRITPWWEMFAWFIMLGVIASGLAVPTNKLAKATEKLAISIHEYAKQLERECIIPGTLPEKPKGNGWRLTWVKDEKVPKRHGRH